MTVLTAVMIAGLVIVITLLVTRFPKVQAPLPDTITLPDGTTPTAFTRGAGWYAVVTDDNRILIFSQSSGALRQTIEIEAD